MKTLIAKRKICNFEWKKIFISVVCILLTAFLIKEDLLDEILTDVPITKMQEVCSMHLVSPGETYAQEIKEENHDFDKLYLYLSMDSNDACFDISLIDSKEDTIFDKTVNVSEYDWNRDLELFKLVIQNDDFSKIQRGTYLLSVTNSSKEDVYFCMNENEELCFETINHTNLGKYMALLVIAICAIYLAFVFLIAYDCSIEKFFLSSVVPLVVVYLIIFMPWNIPDAQAHYAATYRFSNMVLGVDSGDNWIGRAEDASFYSKVWEYSSQNPNMNSYYATVHNTNVIASNMEIVNMPFREDKMKFYSILCYLPEVIGVCIGRILHLGTVPTMYLGRLFMAIAYIAGGYAAVKTTPTGKGMFALIYMLPIALMYSSGYSYDGMIFIVAGNFMACLLNLLYCENSKSALWKLIIWTFLLGGIKGGGYLVLLPMTLLLYNRKDRKLSILKIVYVWVSGLLSVALFDLIVPLGQALFQFGEKGNGMMTASFAWEHPFRFLRMCLITMVRVLGDMICQIGGTQLGWLEQVIPPAYVILFFGLIFIYSMYEKDKYIPTGYFKIMSLFTSVIMFFSTCMMLLSFTNDGLSYVLGLQGRYFWPLLPIILISLSKYRLHTDNSENAPIILCNIRKACAFFSVVFVYYMLRMYLRR